MSSVWSLAVELAYDELPLVSVGVVSDDGGYRFTAGTQEDLENATALEELNEFLQSIGYGSLSPIARPANLNDYSFRFHSLATGSIYVLGGNKENGADAITNNLDSTLTQLNMDPNFTNFMNIISTPGDILVDASADISFSQTIGSNKIASAVGTPFSGLSASDQIEVVGSESNDGTYTVSSVELGGARVVVSQSVTPEIAGAEISIIVLP